MSSENREESKTASVGGGGIVDLSGTLFHVRELSLHGERGLWEELRAEAKAAMGPGSFVAAAMPTVKWLREQDLHEEAAQLLRDANALVLTKAHVSPDAVEEYRRTPDGVATELYHRTRDAHPNVARKEFRAALNQVNCRDVFRSIQEAVSGPKEPTPSTSPAG